MAWYAKFDGVDGELVPDLSVDGTSAKPQQKDGSSGGNAEITWKVEEGESDETLPGIDAGAASPDPELARGKAVILWETLEAADTDGRNTDHFEFETNLRAQGDDDGLGILMGLMLSAEQDEGIVPHVTTLDDLPDLPSADMTPIEIDTLF